jgi:2-dehydropantoate 2-reductase
MDEVRAIAAAEGVDLPEAWIEKSLEAEVNRSSYHTSMRIDLETGRPMEVESIVSRPVRIAARRGIDAPRLRTTEALLLAIQP